jgi:chromosome segregation ATPase
MDVGISMQNKENLEFGFSLDILVNEIEAIYLYLGKQFPEIFSELDAGFKKSNQIIAEITKGKTAGESIDGLTKEKISNQINQIVNETSHNFTKLKENDDALFAAIKKSIERLNSLKTRIDDIREDTSEMEIISINAMALAIKSGFEGKGFSYITEELKRLATFTMAYTDTITQHGRRIANLFAGFQGTLNTVQSFQAGFYQNFYHNITSGFNSFNACIEEIINTLKSMLTNAQLVKKPLFRIMDELQQQDIIKQSMDHLIFSLKELKTEYYSIKDEYKKAIILKIFIELCTSLLDDIDEKLVRSSDVFQGQFDCLEETLCKVEKERKEIIDAASQDVFSHKKFNFRNQYEQSFSQLNELMRSIEESSKQKNRIYDEGKNIEKELKAFNKYFIKSLGIANRFYCIGVVSRIEVAKKDILRERSGLVNEILNLAERIKLDVKAALDDIESSYEQTSKVLQFYRQQLLQEDVYIRDLQNKINQIIQQISEIKDRVEFTVLDFSIYSDRFLRLLKDSKAKVKELSNKTVRLKEIKQQILRMNQKTNLPGKSGDVTTEPEKDYLNLVNDRMKDLINKFTILTHKHLAGDLAGMTVEEGDRSGVLNIFNAKEGA